MNGPENEYRQSQIGGVDKRCRAKLHACFHGDVGQYGWEILEAGPNGFPVDVSDCYLVCMEQLNSPSEMACTETLCKNRCDGFLDPQADTCN